MDLVIEDGSRVDTVYFMMSEDNVRKQVALPWVSFNSDSGSLATEGVFLKSNPHPRAYGNFARLLAKYVRDEKIIPLEEAVRRGNPRLQRFDASCFTGEYVTGDIDRDYLECLARERSDAAKIGHASADNAIIDLHNSA